MSQWLKIYEQDPRFPLTKWIIHEQWKNFDLKKFNDKTAFLKSFFMITNCYHWEEQRDEKTSLSLTFS